MSSTVRGESAASNRRVEKVLEGVLVSDGAGVKLKRIIGQPAMPDLDPFLLLDVFASDNPDDYIAGFPPHPHRGFETVTYMFAGRMKHEDNAGHSGVIEAGGVQWMTAGRGIYHSEMPQQTSGLMWGCQLWVNLPAKEKMKAPAYQELSREQIPVETRDNAALELRVIAGSTTKGTVGAIRDIAVEPVYFDVQFKSAGGRFVEEVPVAHNACLLLLEGEVTVLADDEAQHRRLQAGELAVLAHGTRIVVESNLADSHLLLIAGKPLKEPVARYGPFVMNTEEEIMQAVRDFQSGHF